MVLKFCVLLSKNYSGIMFVCLGQSSTVTVVPLSPNMKVFLKVFKVCWYLKIMNYDHVHCNARIVICLLFYPNALCYLYECFTHLRCLWRYNLNPLHVIATTLCKNFHLVNSKTYILLHCSIFMVVKMDKFPCINPFCNLMMRDIFYSGLFIHF